MALSCVVRIAELGAFYEPTDKADLHCVADVRSPVGLGSPQDPEWNHEEILELPGCEIDHRVAVRPNWYILFEVMDSDPRARDAPPLATAAASLSQVLGEISAAQTPQTTSVSLQARSLKLQSPVAVPLAPKQAVAPGMQTTSTVHIVRELPLLVRGSSLELQTLTSDLSSSLKSTLSPQPAAQDQEQNIFDDERFLVVRFEVRSRWRGTGGGAKCPPVKAMAGPSPVMCLVALISSVVAGHENGNVFVWDVTSASTRPLHQFQAHKVSITTMVHLPMLDCIVTTAAPDRRKEATSESLLRVWNCSTFELRQTLPLHGATSRCLVRLGSEGKAGTACLALGKDTRQSCTVQLMKADAQ